MNYTSTLTFVIITALCGIYGCAGTLSTKRVKIYDNKTRELIGSGYYQSGGGGIHDYPTSEREAPNIIDGIFNGK